MLSSWATSGKASDCSALKTLIAHSLACLKDASRGSAQRGDSIRASPNTPHSAAERHPGFKQKHPLYGAAKRRKEQAETAKPITTSGNGHATKTGNSEEKSTTRSRNGPKKAANIASGGAPTTNDSNAPF